MVQLTQRLLSRAFARFFHVVFFDNKRYNFYNSNKLGRYIMISFHKNMNLVESFHDAKAVLDQINEGVILLDSLGSVTFVNKNFQELLGYGKEDLERLRFDQLLNFLNSDILIQEAKINWINIKNGSKTISRTMKIRHKKGYLILLQLDGSARYDQAGKFAGAILTFRDLLSDLLAQITQNINSSLKLDEILVNIVTIVVDYLGLTSTAVFLYDKKTETLSLKCCNEFEDISNIPNIIIPLGIGAPGIIAERREPIYIANLGETDLINRLTVNESLTKDKFDNRSSIGYPLLYRDELLGVIAFDAANVREFSDREKKNIY